MTNEMREQIRQAIRHFRLPSYKEITDVGLYLEQATRYINEYLFPLGEEALLTTSMVSNYVKHGLVSNPVHKQYSRDQIAMLIFVSMTKSVLSLDQIRQVREFGLKLFEHEEAYEYFRSTLNQGLMYVFGHSMDAPDDITEDEPGEKLIIRSAMIAIAHKVYLNMCFSALEKQASSDVVMPIQKSKKNKKEKAAKTPS